MRLCRARAQTARRLPELYLKQRRLDPSVEPEALAPRLDGHSGADIRHLGDRAAAVASVQSVAKRQPHVITPDTVKAAPAELRPCVGPKILARFERRAQPCS